jgi:hypothetical protein
MLDKLQQLPNLSNLQNLAGTYRERIQDYGGQIREYRERLQDRLG